MEATRHAESEGESETLDRESEERRHREKAGAKEECIVTHCTKD